MRVTNYSSRSARVAAALRAARHEAECILLKKAAQGPLFCKSYSQLQSLSFFGVRLIRTPMSGAALLPS